MTDLDASTTSEQALDARLQLDVAVQQLVTPAVEQLDRSRAEADPAVGAIDEETARTHAEQMARLLTRHAAALRHRDKADARRALAALIGREQTYRAELAARQLIAAPVPSLLDLLAEAVESSRGTGAPVGPYRSPIGFDAAELLGEIQRTIGHRGGPLAHTLRGWADHVADAEPTDIIEHAARAEHWVAAARGIIEPDRGFEVRGACPTCRTRYVWVQDGDQRVRRSALQLSYATRTARCISPGCTGRWGPEYLEHLARVVVQDRDERDTRDPDTPA